MEFKGEFSGLNIFLELGIIIIAIIIGFVFGTITKGCP